MRWLVAGVAAAVIAAACTGDDGGQVSPTTADSTTTTIAAVTPTTVNASDGRLTVGLLLPAQSPDGENDELATGLRQGARRARRDIGRAGGQLRLVEAVEHETADETIQSLEELYGEGVDAIVGPTSSVITIGVLTDIVEADVLACSPTASSALLDDFPDDGRFFRSIPSESLLAETLADRARASGATTVTIGYLDDRYGRSLLDAVEEALGLTADVKISDRVEIVPGDDNLVDEARELLDDDPGAVMLLADSTTGPQLLSSIGRQFRGSDQPAPPKIFVNDAFRRPAQGRRLIQRLPDSVREQVVGLSPDAIPPTDSELTGSYAVNAYNCVTAIALARRSAESDEAGDMAAAITGIADTGVSCLDYDQCVDLLQQDVPLNINYVGPDRFFNLDASGEHANAQGFDEFEFDERGVDVSTGL